MYGKLVYNFNVTPDSSFGLLSLLYLCCFIFILTIPNVFLEESTISM